MDLSIVSSTLPLAIAPLVLLVGSLIVRGLGRRRGALPLVLAMVALLVACLPVLLAMPAALRGATVVDSAVLRLFRVGSADLVLGHQLDRPALGFALAALLLTAGAIGGALRVERLHGRAPFSLATALWFGALSTAAVLANGFATALLWSGLAIASAAVAAEMRAVLLRFSALLPITAAAALLFWSLGGQWLDEQRYLSDYRARFAISGEEGERTRSLANARAVGYLTVLSHPGSDLYLGVATETQLARSNPIARTPFTRLEVPVGLQKIAIVPGDGALIAGEGVEAALLDTVNIRAGEETVIGLVGSTLSFVEIRAQVDAKGSSLGKSVEAPSIPNRRIAGQKVGTFGAGLLVLALLLSVAGHLGRGAGLLEPFALFGQLGLVATASRLTPVIGSSSLLLWGLAAVVLVLALSVSQRASGAAAAVGLSAVGLLTGNAEAGVLALLALGLLGFALTESGTASRTVAVPVDALPEPEAQRGKSAGAKSKKKKAAEPRVEQPVKTAEPSDAPRPRNFVEWALGLPIPLFGVALPAGCVALAGFASSLTQGLLGAFATAIAWSSLSLLLCEPQQAARVSASSRPLALMAVAIPMLLTLLLRPFVVDSSLGLVGPLLMLPPWGLAFVASRIARSRKPLERPAFAASSVTEGGWGEQLWAIAGAPLSLPARLFRERDTTTSAKDEA